MATTVATKITEIAGMKNHAYADAIMLGWINKVEQLAFSKYVEKWAKATITTVASQAAYDYPAGVTFDKINREIIYNGIKYTKIDCRTDTDYDSTYEYNFFDTTTKINFSVAPTVADETIVVPYRYAPTVKLIANIATDTLLIDDTFNDVYEYYCIYRIQQLANEEDMVNWWAYFEAKMEEWAEFYYKNSPVEPQEQIISTW